MEEFKQDTIDQTLLIQATLNNSPGILRALLGSKLPVERMKKSTADTIFTRALEEPVPNTKEGEEDSASAKNRSPIDYTPLDWAVALDFKDCINVLSAESQPSNPEVYDLCHPLLAINYISSSKYDIADLTQRLIENGFTVQNCMESWKQYPTSRSPIFLAVQSKHVLHVGLLLSHGIDLEIMYDVFDLRFRANIFKLFLDNNANICNKNGSVVQQILRHYDKSRISCLLNLVVHTAYHIPRKSMDEIAEFCASHDDTGWFKCYKETPLSLQHWCRKSFRKYAGYKIRVILANVILPGDLKNYLLLRDELKVLDE